MKKIFSLFTSSNHSILLLFTLVIFFEKWSLLCRPHLTTKATHAKSNGDHHIAKSYLFSCPLILELLTTIDMVIIIFPFLSWFHNLTLTLFILLPSKGRVCVLNP